MGSIAGDAAADLFEASELFDIDVDHLAGSGTVITAHRFGRFSEVAIGAPLRKAESGVSRATDKTTTQSLSVREALSLYSPGAVGLLKVSLHLTAY